LDLWWLAPFSLVPLLVAIRDVSWRRASGLGLIAGFVLHIGAQSWWFGLLRRFAHLPVPAALGCSAAAIAWSAVEFAAWVWLARALADRARLPWIAAGPLAVGMVEAIWPALFEWHLGVLLWRAWPLVQVAELGGAASVSALVVLINAVVTEVVIALRMRRAPGWPASIGGGIAGVVIAAGVVRAQAIDSMQAAAPKVDVGIVQPNFGPMTLEERSREGRHVVAALRNATRELAEAGAELIVWPESAWPYLWDRRRDQDFPVRHPWSLRERPSATLLLGTLTHPFGSGELYNSAVLLREDGQVGGISDKLELVAFSEYVPFGDRFPIWRDLVKRQLRERPDILLGERAVVLENGSVRMGVLICSEDLDGRAALAKSALGANLLVSMANDGWFEGSAAVQQHLALASLRAVETRRHLVRVTTNGVSAHVDAVGRLRLEGPVVAARPGERKPATTLRVQAALLSDPTLDGVTIRYFSHACAALTCACLLGSVRARPRARRPRRLASHPTGSGTR
jgi:apolipoprotein N-acyltransferase